MAKDHGYKFRLTLLEREVFLFSDEEEEVGPLRRNFIKHGWLGNTRMSHDIATKMGIIEFMRGLNDVANDGIAAFITGQAIVVDGGQYRTG
jgi:hypothetical protein